MKHLTTASLYQKLLIIILPLTAGAQQQTYNYDEPHLWPLEYPQCFGNEQSPIALNTHKSIPLSLPPIIFGNYDIPLSELIQLNNNGHSVELSIPSTINGQHPFITGSLMDNIYEVQGVHFHWGSKNSKGSEHTINGRRYDMEMHVVHRNIKYKNIDEAAKFSDGIAVLGVMFKAVHAPNVYYPGLNTIYNNVDDVILYNSNATTSNYITLESLLGDLNRDAYFSYRGSLSTPPCSEAVTWIVFTDVLPIPYSQMRKFWNVLDAKGFRLSNNFRPLQPLNLRRVYFNKGSRGYAGLKR